MPDQYDYAFEETEKKLAELERRIYRVYGQASKDMARKAERYFEYFVVRDREMQKLLKSGVMTEEHYKLWRLAQIGRGKRMEALRDDLAQRANTANETAMAYVRDETPTIYSLNYNYSAYTIEIVHGNVGFTIYDEQTVRRLLMDDPDLLPMPNVDVARDIAWNRVKMQDALTSGILQGETYGKIADRFQQVAVMNRTSALRNARTAFTGAQNAGREETYERAVRMGIDLGKQWDCIKDGETRHDHGVADGQVVRIHEMFEVGGHLLRYPGDPHGPPEQVFNCRCKTRSVEKEGIEAEARKMRVHDPLTGRNIVVSEMTYTEWKRWVKRRTDGV